jgi:hypothetical protein
LGRARMSERELDRAGVLARVCSKELKLVDGARLMQVSYRQAIRLKQVFRVSGATHTLAGDHRAGEAAPLRGLPGGRPATTQQDYSRRRASLAASRQEGRRHARTGAGFPAVARQLSGSSSVLRVALTGSAPDRAAARDQHPPTKKGDILIEVRDVTF